VRRKISHQKKEREEKTVDENKSREMAEICLESAKYNVTLEALSNMNNVEKCLLGRVVQACSNGDVNMKKLYDEMVGRGVNFHL
jgi:hypothetical protein